MGQKVHPFVQRLGFLTNWRSLWFADRKQYAQNVVEDFKIRQYIKKKFIHAAVAYIMIERLTDQVKVTIFSGRPGIIIGRRGADIDNLKRELANITNLAKSANKELEINVKPIENPAVDSTLVAQSIAFQLEKRVAFRRAAKRAIDQGRMAGCQGIKVRMAGRLGGAEMARTETYHDGSIPLQTLRADVDYGFAEALTTYGLIGVKVWIYKGQVIREKNREQAHKPPKGANDVVDAAKG